MNALHAIALTTLLAAAAPAVAGDNMVHSLSQQSGLSQQDVRMVLGARSSHAMYPSRYPRALAKLEAVIGKENTYRLQKGQAIKWQPEDAARDAVASTGNTPR